MATTLTYDSLVDDLTGYLDRGSLDSGRVQAAIPRRINDAENAMIADLKLQGYEHTLHDYLAAGTGLLRKPARWKQTLSMHIVVGAKRMPIFARSYEYLRAFWPNEALLGQPAFYADLDKDNWALAATPDSAYPVEVKCYLAPQLLGPETQTNVLTELAPNPLRYRALKEMALYLKKYDLVALFDGEYKNALGAIGQEDNLKIRDRAASRDGV
jgi:hypothetical protein